MEIKVSGGSLQESSADTVIVNLFEGAKDRKSVV